MVGPPVADAPPNWAAMNAACSARLAFGFPVAPQPRSPKLTPWAQRNCSLPLRVLNPPRPSNNVETVRYLNSFRSPPMLRFQRGIASPRYTAVSPNVTSLRDKRPSPFASLYTIGRWKNAPAE